MEAPVVTLMQMLEVLLLGETRLCGHGLAQAEGSECLGACSELCPQLWWNGGYSGGLQLYLLSL